MEKDAFGTKTNFVIYLFHHFFKSLSLHLFFVFGAVLLYVKTQSILVVLAFGAIGALTIIFMSTAGLRWFVQSLNRLKLKKSMVLGMVCIALADLGLFFVPANLDIALFTIAIFLLAVVRSFSSTFYYIPANAIRFEFIGVSEKPGRVSALITNIGVASSLAAVGIGLIFSGSGPSFLYLFVVSGVSLFVSMLTLFLMTLPHIVYETKFPDYVKTLSVKTMGAFIEFSQELHRTVLPLVIFFLLGAFTKSLWVIALSSLGAILGAYFTGILKDKESNNIIMLGGSILFGSWVFYAMSIAPWHFIVLGVLVGIASKIISTARDARFGREATNGTSTFEAIFPTELSKSLSRLVALLVTFLIVVLLDRIPQSILILGALFVLPHIIYALGSIEERKQTKNLSAIP